MKMFRDPLKVDIMSPRDGFVSDTDSYREI